MSRTAHEFPSTQSNLNGDGKCQRGQGEKDQADTQVEDQRPLGPVQGDDQLSGRSDSWLASPTRWTLTSQPSNAPVTSTRAGMYWRASPWPTSTSADRVSVV